MKSWIHQIDVNGQREQLDDWNQINWQKVRKLVKSLQKRIFRARKLGQWKQLRRLQKLLNKWLTAGYIDKGKYYQTKTGTPQGGVISPLLANIGLHGLEELIKIVKLPKDKWGNRPKLGFVRYADDFIVTANSKETLEEVQELIKNWLSERGLELREEKTRIVHRNQGFDFLGFNLRHYDGKLLIKPQKDKVLSFCKELGKTISSCQSWTQENLITKLNPILRGFANYYKGVVSKEIFNYIQYRLFKYLWKWAKRRHPMKSKTWIKNKYFPRYEGNTGFDFLGFNIRQYEVGQTHSGACRGVPLGYKTIIKPSQDKIKSHIKKIGDVIDKDKSSPQIALIKELNPIIRGWANYYSSVCSKETYSRCDHLLYQQLKRWAEQRHPNKSKSWVAKKYWHTWGLRT